jgi:hypothetical protein
MGSLNDQSVFLLHCDQTGFEAHQASYRTNIGAFSSGEKWPVLEADHTLPPNAQVNRRHGSFPYVSS